MTLCLAATLTKCAFLVTVQCHQIEGRLLYNNQDNVWKSPMLHAVALHAPAQWAVLTHTWCIRTRRVSLFCNCMVGKHLSLFPVCLYRIPSNQRRDKVVSLDDRHGNCFSIHFVKHMRLSPFLRVFFDTWNQNIAPVRTPDSSNLVLCWFFKIWSLAWTGLV